MGNKKNKLSKNIFSGKTILQGMPELAYVFNKENRLEMWNKNLETILGYTKEELQQKYVTDFIAKEDREKTLETIAKMFTEKKEQTIEYHLVTKHGEYLPYIGSGSFTIANNKEYFVGMAISTSKLKNTELDLKNKIEELYQLKNQLKNEVIYLREEITNIGDFQNIVGNSDSLLKTLFQLEKVAVTNSSVLIVGEFGTRKEVFARSIHNLSNRKNNSFIKIDCSTLSEKKLKQETHKNLFLDFEKSIYSKLKIANKGTIYLDEINELSLEVQSKLLEVFQTNKIYSPENNTFTNIDIRLIASTSQDLDKLIKKKRILKDFFYLNSFLLKVPPLRERISDIPILVKNFVTQFNKKYNKNISKIPKNTLDTLQKYNWPENIRELENIIEKAVILSSKSLLKLEQMDILKGQQKDNVLTLNEYEHEYIIKILNMTFWRISGDKGAAKILGLHPETLRSRMRKLKIRRPYIA